MNNKGRSLREARTLRDTVGFEGSDSTLEVATPPRRHWEMPSCWAWGKKDDKHLGKKPFWRRKWRGFILQTVWPS